MGGRNGGTLQNGARARSLELRPLASLLSLAHRTGTPTAPYLNLAKQAYLLFPV